MEKIEIKSAIEAILFACGEPCEASKIAAVLETDESTVFEIAKELQTEYETRGINLIFINDMMQFCSNPKYV